jgi:endonuclease/exonuclease/phosphatase family metal-dependent hydrolase
MKLTTRILALLLLLTLCFAALPACDSGDSTPDTTVAETTAAPTEAPTEPPEPRLTVDSSYRIVVPAEADETTQKTAAALAAALKEKAGLELTVVTDAEEPIAHELVLGHTNRADSTAAEGGYELFQSGEALYIDAEDPITLYYAVQAILDAWLTPDFGLANAGVVTLLESRVADLNGLATKRDTSIKVLSQNLRCADDPNGNSIGERARRFKQLFEEYQPDLLGTQETTAGWNNYLKKFGGSEYGMVGCSRDGREATSGEWNTILYRKDRFELLDSDTTWLSNTPTEATKVEGALCLRICTWALLKDKLTGETILFANTHLDHSNDEVRSAQMDILMDYLADRIGQYPFYLTGDFNCNVDSIPYNTATARLLDSHKTAWVDFSTETRTYHAYQRRGGSEIDFIFHNDHTTPVQYEIISKDYGGYVSDHYGVIAEFVNE